MSIVRKMKSYEIAEILYHEILNNRVCPDTPVMSTSQIAEHFHVCLMTAHKALDYLEKQDVIYRIKGKGSFVKKGCPSTSPLTIGCAFMEYEHHQDSMREILMETFPNTAMKCFQSHGCVCRLIPYVFFHDSHYWEGLDGVLASVNLIDESTQGMLRDAGIPVVVFQGELERDFPFDQVIPDHAVALEELFSHASPEDYTGGMVFSYAHPNGMARAEAFQHAARKAGFEVTNMVCRMREYKECYRRCLQLGEQCRGKLIFSCSDYLTFEIVDALHEKGLEFNRDYEIIGYDNLEGKGITPYGHPRITAMDYSLETAAEVAAELLLDTIRDKKNYRRIIKIPTKLTIRESALNNR